VSKKLSRQGLVREMTEKDLARVLQWRNHIDVRRFMFSQEEITAEEHRNWFKEVSQDSRRHLLIFEINGVPSGSVNFSLHDNNLVADWGFYLAPDAAKGSGRQLGLVSLDYAIYTLGLHKLCGEILGFNERSIKYHFELGFKQEGVLREQYFDGENYCNIICFGLLAVEWNQNCRENL
jgi:UDP-4-amino-4,6-dideoxy-N-acetyl-beta-L-altrosamine N-acetyltransferase